MDNIKKAAIQVHNINSKLRHFKLTPSEKAGTELELQQALVDLGKALNADADKAMAEGVRRVMGVPKGAKKEDMRVMELEK